MKTPSAKTHLDHFFAPVNLVFPEKVSPALVGCLLHFLPAVLMKRYQTYIKSIEITGKSSVRGIV